MTDPTFTVTRLPTPVKHLLQNEQFLSSFLLVISHPSASI